MRIRKVKMSRKQIAISKILMQPFFATKGNFKWFNWSEV